MKQEQILIRRQVTVFSSITSLILKIVELVTSLIIHFRSYPENEDFFLQNEDFQFLRVKISFVSQLRFSEILLLFVYLYSRI